MCVVCRVPCVCVLGCACACACVCGRGCACVCVCVRGVRVGSVRAIFSVCVFGLYLGWAFRAASASVVCVCARSLASVMVLLSVAFSSMSGTFLTVLCSELSTEAGGSLKRADHNASSLDSFCDRVGDVKWVTPCFPRVMTDEEATRSVTERIRSE